MASRTKQKEEARARRLAEEQARTERERRQRLLRMLAGVAVGAIVVIAVAVAISTSGGGSSSNGLRAGSQSSALSAQVQQLLGGIPQSGPRLGNPSAPITMTYYGDLECPVCQQFTLNGGFPQLVANEVRAGKVQVVYRAFQTATPSPTTFQTQQAAALAAGKQNHFWDFAELFYRQQGQEDTDYVTDSYLSGIAKQIPGLSFSAWQSERTDPTLVSQVQADIQSGNGAHVQGTPTLIFKGPKGTAEPSAGVPSYSDLQQAIKQVS